MYFEHMIKDGFILFHTQRNMRYLFIAHIYNENKLYNQGTNRAIARHPGHSSIRFLNSHMGKEFLISIGDIFQTWAPKY